jgi:hypothetical protein
MPVHVPARGLPTPLSGAALASWLVPSSAFLLKKRCHSLKSPTSAQAALSRRLPHMSSRLHSLSGCRAGAFACASLARGEKPAGSTQAGEHRGVRLSQSAMLILRHQRCSDPRPRRRWQAWSCRADPDLSLSGLPHHVQCSAPYPALPFENPFTPDRSRADSAGRRTRPFSGGTGLRLSTSHDHDLALARSPCTLRHCTSTISATSSSRTCSWTNCEPGCAAPNRSSGCGWPSILARNFFLCLSSVPAHNIWRMCSSTRSERAWPRAVSRSLPVTGSISTFMRSQPTLDTGA